MWICTLKNFLKKFPLLVQILRKIWNTVILRRGKGVFLSKLNKNSKILDVGCGNDSPAYIKKVLPDCIYTGIDIVDCKYAEKFPKCKIIISRPEIFHTNIENFEDEFDAVISTHNIEHCDERAKVLDAMLRSVKLGGRLYLKFPCEQSVNFPSRAGTLNYGHLEECLISAMVD